MLGFETLLDQIQHPSGNANAGVAPGKRATTTGLAPRGGAPVDDATRGGLGLAVDGARERSKLNLELHELADAARNLQRGGIPAPEACTSMAALVSAAVPLAQALVRLAGQNEKEIGQARAQLDSPFFFAKQAAADALAEHAADATPKNDAAGLRALDTLAEISHDLAAKAGADPRAGLPLGALGSLAVVAAPLGWQAPTSRAEALAARLQRTPCGVDGVAENPGECSWTEAERTIHVGEMHRRLGEVFVALSQACAAESKALTAAIQRDAKMAEAIADMVLDLLLVVAPKAIKSTAEVAVAKGVAEVGKDAAKKAKTMRDVLIGLRTDIADTLTKKFTGTLKKKVTDAVAKGDDDPRQNTVTVVEELPGLFQDALFKLDDKALSDHDILRLEFAAENSRARVAAGVKRLVAAYRRNLEPLGQTRIAPGIPTGTRTETIAARLHPPAGGPPRLAMVKHTTDLDPMARRREAAPIVGLAEVAHAMHAISDETNAEVHERGADSGERYEFVRWIDAPAATAGIDIAGMADADAIDLPLTRVTGLALDQLAGTAR